MLPDGGGGTTRPFVELYPTLTPARIGALRRGGCRSMWLISSHVGQSDGPEESRSHLRRWLGLRVRLQRAFGPELATSAGWASKILVGRFSRRGPGRHRG